MLTLQEPLDRIDDVLHGPPSAENGLLRIVNDAGRIMLGLRSWNWTQATSTAGNLVANQPFIRLPAGCTEVWKVTRRGTLVGSIELTTHAELSDMRALDSTPSGEVSYCAPEWVEKSEGGMEMRLAVWRPPASTAANGVSVDYRRGWIALTTCEKPRTTIAIPDFLEPLYLRMVEAVALGMEERSQGSIDARVAEIVAGPIFKAAVRVDTESASSRGTITTGWLEAGRRRGRPYPNFNTGPMADPA